MTKADIKNYTDVMLTAEVAEVLYDLISEVSFSYEGRIVETGTGFGRSAKFFAELRPNWTIYTVDAFGLYGDGRVYKKLDHDSVAQVFDYLSPCKNIIHILGDSADVPWELDIDILYIDGDHSYDGCRKDFERYEKFIIGGGLLIFDDYIQPNNTGNGVGKFVREVVDKKTKEYYPMYTGTAAIYKKITIYKNENY